MVLLPVFDDLCPIFSPRFYRPLVDQEPDIGLIATPVTAEVTTESSLIG